MKFNPRARLSSSQVRRRGPSSGGRGGMGGLSRGGLPGGMVLPGGIGGVVILVVVVLFTQFGGGSGGDTASTGYDGTEIEGAEIEGTDLSQCRTGADANASQDCRIVGTVNSVQAYWDDALPEQADVDYTESVTNLFSGSVDTGCGAATSDVGPFYCPTDASVYLDMSFFDAMLEQQLGARGGDFAEAYVVAHEYGHHVQHLLGTTQRVRSEQGATSDSVRLELQADCYAGMWARHATTVEDEFGETYILELSEGDVAEAIDAAESVGDDRIQEQTQGRSDPETWTHGSAADRKQWFLTGMSAGSLAACDTFSASTL